MGIDEVLLKLKAGEPVELCDIYSTVNLEGKAGEDKRRAALSAWLSSNSNGDYLTQIVNLLDEVISNGRVNVEPLGRPDASLTLAAGASSVNLGIPSNTHRLSLVALGADICFKLGTSNSVSAASTDHYLQAGERIDIDVKNHTHIAAIRAGSTNGTLRISQLV